MDRIEFGEFVEVMERVLNDEKDIIITVINNDCYITSSGTLSNFEDMTNDDGLSFYLAYENEDVSEMHIKNVKFVEIDKMDILSVKVTTSCGCVLISTT